MYPLVQMTIFLVVLFLIIMFLLVIAIQHFGKRNINNFFQKIDYYICSYKALMILYTIVTAFLIGFFLFMLLLHIGTVWALTS